MHNDIQSLLLAEFYTKEWHLRAALKRKKGAAVVSHEYRSIHKTKVCVNYDKKLSIFTELIAFSPNEHELFIKIKL